MSTHSHPTQKNGKYTEELRWHSTTGADLAVYVRKAKKPVRGVIHINHGLAEHAGRYARFAEALSSAGFHVYAQDHRGHGDTKAEDAEQGVFSPKDGWIKVLEDMHFMNSKIREENPALPIIIFGHSMGAILSYNYMLRWPETVQGAAIWNGSVSKSPTLGLLKFVTKIERIFKGASGISIATKLSFDEFNKKFKPNQTSCDWLTKDVAEARAYEDDPDCGWRPSVSLWQDMAKLIGMGSKDFGLAEVPRDMPFYIMGGDADPSVNFAKDTVDLESRLKAAGLTNIKTDVRINGRHEALNEPLEERNAVTDGFINWATKVST